MVGKSSAYVIARRSRSNLTVLQGNDAEIAALPLVARNDASQFLFVGLSFLSREAYQIRR
ncbi:protein of unknown function [Candidatus Methylomirabilis oxygeniifera]|uniref:Uncharacterized protein n=1 Tax=Methylomirabilis oxygeniifera TaxID=671143 RepID=D5MF45_METO1|nr:protein of unknown function [Candidatus Methylomirabilis oxyfera]